MLKQTRREVYEQHLQSPMWQQQRQGAFARWGRFCGCCGADNAVHVHHLNYRDLVNCKPDDFMPLCGVCHERVHSIPELDKMARVDGNAMHKRRMVIMRLNQKSPKPVESVRIVYLSQPKIKNKRKPKVRAAAVVGVDAAPVVDSGELMTLSAQDVQALRTDMNSFTGTTIRELGMTWGKLEAGWVDRLVGSTMFRSKYLRALAGREVFKKRRRNAQAGTSVTK